MADFNVNHITNKEGNYGPVISGVATVNSTGAMRIPSGNIARRVEYIPQSENIVTDGLVLHLDFGNPDCFVGGTHVRDLSGAGVLGIGTIEGQASFSPDGGGCMKFYNNSNGNINFGPVYQTSETKDNFILSADGENRSSGVSTSGTHGGGNDLTVYAWVGEVDMTNSANVIMSVWYSTAGSGWLVACNETAADGNRPMPAAIVSDGGDGSGAWTRPGWNGPNIPEYDQRSLNYYQTELSVNSGVGNTTLAVGKDVFTNITFQLIRRGDNKWDSKSHINGNQPFIHANTGANHGTETGTWGDSQSRNIRIGANDYDVATPGSGSRLKGKIAIIMVYNRELSDAEVQQNYNAHRYRFGR